MSIKDKAGVEEGARTRERRRVSLDRPYLHKGRRVPTSMEGVSASPLNVRKLLTPSSTTEKRRCMSHVSSEETCKFD